VHAVRKVAITLGIILLVVLICPPVTAYADLADQYFSEGINFSNLGQYSDAVASYDKAVFIRPNNADAWLNRGIALDNLYRYSDAVASYDKAIVIRPNDADVWNNRGIALRKLGWYADAVASYDKAIAIKPDYANAWLNRGVAQDYLGHYADAVASYDKAIALEPDYTIAQENREIALNKQKQSNLIPVMVTFILIVIIAGGTIWKIKSGKPSQQKTEKKRPEKKRPEKKLPARKIQENRLITLANLCGVINKYGFSILDEPKKVEALLNDMSDGNYKSERDVLITALQENIPQELLKSQRSAYLRNTSTRNKKRLIFRKRLIENYGIPEDLAQWAVESWVKALGIKR
jgi:Flp pilus assembly protein TadD